MADELTLAGDREETTLTPDVQPANAEAPAGSTPPLGTGPSGAVPRRKIEARTVFYLAGGVITVLLLLVGGTYAWKVWVVRGLERRFAAEQNQLATTQRQALNVQARDMLRIAARPLAWAVRAELLRGNVGQVDDYFREFVRERGVNSVLLVGPDGKILLATNRKLETQAADAFVSKTVLETPDVTIEEAGGLLRLGVPVMGFDRRLGLLVIDYDPGAKYPVSELR
jgi:hypothetical protein